MSSSVTLYASPRFTDFCTTFSPATAICGSLILSIYIMPVFFHLHLTPRRGFFSHCLISAVLVSSLTGCQSWVKPASSATTQPPIAAAKNFQLTGKIGVRTPQQSGSAFYAWAQQDQRFAIELTGALGIGQTRIEGGNGQFSLENNTSGRLEADSAEALLKQATGWQAPISQLPRWVMGMPIAADSPATYDSQTRLATLTEQGWQVRFDYLDAAQPRRPSRLIMTQALFDSAGQAAGENRVTLTIQSRQQH